MASSDILSDLVKDLYKTKRAEDMRASSATTGLTKTYTGTAVSNSSDGYVTVVLDDAGTQVTLPTTVQVYNEDAVLISSVANNGIENLTVTGVVGRGDEVQAQITQAMEKADAGGTRVFMEQPTPPYNKGDLWAMAPTTVEGDYADAGAPTIAEHEQAGATYGSMEAYEGRTMLVCTHDRAKGESFDKGDWTVSLELNGHYATHSDLTRTESEIRSEVGDELKVLRGDVEAEAVARQSAIDQKAGEITASVGESYATKDALNGEVASRESIVRQTANGVEVAKKVNGAYTGTKAVIDDDSFDIVSQSGQIIASYGASKVELGKHSASTIVELCNGNGKISTVGDWTTIESPKTGSLELKGGVGTEQQAVVSVSGGARPQVTLVRADGIGDADSVIRMSGSGISITGGEKGITTGNIKLGGGTMLKAVYCGSTVVWIDPNGNAKLLSGSTYGTKAIGWSNLIVSSGDHRVFTGHISAWWANDSSGDWWVHADVTSKNIRVNWTLFVW